MIETHAHLNFPKFKDDLKAVIQNAKQAGIDRFINIGTTLQTSQESIKLANTHPEIFATVGIHPCNAEEWGSDVQSFFNNQITLNKKIVAIGETGIDYYRVPPTDPHPDHPQKTHREIQQEAFRAQINLARQHQLPFVIHCRNANGTSWRDQGSASQEIWQILQEEKYFNCVFHCFAENLEFAKQLWEQGIYLSFNGTITYPKNEHTREVATHCPKELYIFETDCPFLPPQSKRGQRNEPAFIKEFAEHFSDLRPESFEEIAKQSTLNSEKLFNLIS